MAKLKLEKTKCNSCKRCTYVCPLGIFKSDNSPYPIIDAERVNFCLECGHCVAICETSAISLDEITMGESIEIEKKTSFNALSNIVQSRRSIRKYGDKTIPQEKIEKLIQLTNWMPTAKNQRPVNWTVIQDPSKVQTLSEMTVQLFKERNILPEIVDAWTNGEDVVNRGAPHLVLCHTKRDALMPVVDSTIAMTAFDLAASALDLGTCWAGFFMMALKESPRIRKECGIPDDEDVHTAMMLGIPKFKYKTIPNRANINVNWQ